MRYEYPCDIVRDVEEFEATGREAYVVTFPDVPPAITGGLSWKNRLNWPRTVWEVPLASM